MVQLTVQTQGKGPKMDAEAANAATQQNKNNEDVEDDPKVLSRRLRVTEATVHMLRFHLILVLMILMAIIAFSLYFQKNYVCTSLSKTPEPVKSEDNQVTNNPLEDNLVYKMEKMEITETGGEAISFDSVERNYYTLADRLKVVTNQYAAEKQRSEDFERANVALLGSLVELYVYSKDRTEKCNLTDIKDLQSFLPKEALHYLDLDDLMQMS